MRMHHRVALGMAFLAVVSFTGVAGAQPPQATTGPVKKRITSTRAAHPSTHKLTKPGIVGTKFGVKLPTNSCPVTALQADVVAIDHPMVFNRLGAQNVNWMMYALRHDVIDLKSNKPLDYSKTGEELFEKVRTRRTTSRDIALRPDLRPRPLVLRVSGDGYLKVVFTNLLEVRAVPPHKTPGNPFNSLPNPLPNVDHPMEHAAKDDPLVPDRILNHIDDQVASRVVGFHPQGLELVRTIGDDSSYVGRNNSSLAPPGETKEYCFFAPKEGAYLVSNPGAVFGGEGTAGNSGVGLFAAVTVQPQRAKFYRAQVTEEELRLATTSVTPTGQPIVNYEATYPAVSPWLEEGRQAFRF